MPILPAPNPTGTSTLAYVPGDAECVSGIFPNSWMDGRKLLGRGLDGELSTVPIEITDLTTWLVPAGETTLGQNFHLGFGGGGGSVYTKIGYASDIWGGKVHHWADRGSSGPARRDVPADGSDPVYAILENRGRGIPPGLTFRTSESVQMVDDCSDSPAGLVASLEFNGPPKASTDQSLYLEEQSSPSSHRFFFPAPIDWGVENPTRRHGGILLRRVDAAGEATWTGLKTSAWNTLPVVSGAVYDVYWFYRLPVQVKGLAPNVLGSYGGFSKQITVDPKPGTPVLYSANSTADGLGANLSWETGNVGRRNLTAAEAEVRQNGVVVSTGNAIAFDPNWQNDQPIGQVPLPRRGETFQVRVRYMTETGVWSDYSAPKDVTTTSPTFDPGTYWDGSFDADKDNVYSWEGTANGSASVRSMYRVNDMFSDGSYLKELSVTDPSSPVKTQGSRVFSLRRDRTALATAGFRARYRPVIESLVARLSFWVKFTPNEVYGDPDTSPIRTRFRVYESGIVAEKITETIDLVPGEWIQVVSEPLELRSGSFNLIAARMYSPSRRLGPGDVLSFDGIMLSTGGAFFDYFDGATPNGGQFTYSWTGEANDSSSLRELTVAADPRKPFLDPDCPPVPVAPRPPVVDPSCGEVDADTWRRYWIEIPQRETFTSRALLPTLRITTGYFAESLVRIRFWPNPDNTPAMLFDESGGFDGELIISYIPANAEMILDGVSRILTGSTNGSEPQILNNLLSGTDGTPATWLVLDCERGWLISVDVLPESQEGDLDVSVDLTARMG